MSYVQLSEGGFQVVYPLGLWSRFSGVAAWMGGRHLTKLVVHYSTAKSLSLCGPTSLSCESSLVI